MTERHHPRHSSNQEIDSSPAKPKLFTKWTVLTTVGVGGAIASFESGNITAGVVFSVITGGVLIAENKNTFRLPQEPIDYNKASPYIKNRLGDPDITRGSKDKEGFSLSLNRGTELLETYLGIEITDPPAKIINNQYNRNILKKKNQSALLHEAHGEYDIEYHAYFLDEKASIEGELHENMHAYLAVENPEIPSFTQRLHSLRNHILLGVKPLEGYPSEQEIEKALTFHTFNEGLATFASRAVVAELEAQEKKEKYFEEEFKSIRLEVDEELLEQTQTLIPTEEDVFIFLREELDIEKEIFSIKKHSIKTIRERTKLKARQKDMGLVKYIAGDIFVRDALAKLYDEGIELGDGIRALVKNPPTTLADLEDPTSFVTEKILTKS